MFNKEWPLKSEIVEYWHNFARDAYQMKHFGDTSWYDNMPKFAHDVFIDPGEPSCWGCDWYTLDWDYCNWTGRSKKRGWDDLFANWNRLPLERAHIIPRSRGGNDHPSNFVLLCEICHQESPDTIDPNYLVTWLNNRKQVLTEKAVKEWTEACKTLGLDPLEMLYRLIFIREFINDDYRDFSGSFDTVHGFSYPLTSRLASVDAYVKKTKFDGAKILKRLKGPGSTENVEKVYHWLLLEGSNFTQLEFDYGSDSGLPPRDT